MATTISGTPSPVMSPMAGDDHARPVPVVCWTSPRVLVRVVSSVSDVVAADEGSAGHPGTPTADAATTRVTTAHRTRLVDTRNDHLSANPDLLPIGAPRSELTVSSGFPRAPVLPVPGALELTSSG
jgi:hypothetical protein